MEALDEIYKICRLLYRSDLNMSAKKSSVIFKMNISIFRVFQNFFEATFAFFTLNLDNILSEFRDTSQNMHKYHLIYPTL